MHILLVSFILNEEFHLVLTCIIYICKLHNEIFNVSFVISFVYHVYVPIYLLSLKEERNLNVCMSLFTCDLDTD